MKTFQVNEGSVSFNVMDEEAVVIHIDTSNYFSMNQTGTYLWSLLTERYCSSDELVRAISSGYAQEVDSARNDVAAETALKPAALSSPVCRQAGSS